MASLDEELLHDEEENRREIAFIRDQLSNDLKEKFNENSGCAETEGNKDAGCCTDVCENRSNGSDTEIKSVDEESKEELI